MEYQGVGCFHLGSCSLIEARGKGLFSEKGNRGPAIRCLDGSLFWEIKVWRGSGSALFLQAICNHSSPLLPFYFKALGFGVAILDSKPLIDNIHMVVSAESPTPCPKLHKFAFTPLAAPAS